MTQPPAGAVEVGDWVAGERLYRCGPAIVGDAHVSVVGSQDGNGWTVSGVELSIPGALAVNGRPIPVSVDLTVDQARALAAALIDAADDAQRRDGLVPLVM